MNNNSSLRTLIGEHFNMEELRGLCAALSVNFEDLAGDNLTAKCRNLVEYFSRRKNMGILLGGIHRRRPWLNLSPWGGLIPITLQSYLRSVMGGNYLSLDDIKTMAFDMGLSDTITGLSGAEAKRQALIHAVLQKNMMSNLLSAYYTVNSHRYYEILPTVKALMQHERHALDPTPIPAAPSTPEKEIPFKNIELLNLIGDAKELLRRMEELLES